MASGGGRKTGDQLVTVNMDELGDLFSKAPKNAYYARKSVPANKKASMVSEKEILPSGAEEEKPRCPFCGKTFKRSANLHLHIERVCRHTSQFPKFNTCTQHCTLDIFFRRTQNHQLLFRSSQYQKRIDVISVRESKFV